MRALSPFPDDVHERIASMARQHAALDRPERAGARDGYTPQVTEAPGCGPVRSVRTNPGRVEAGMTDTSAAETKAAEERPSVPIRVGRACRTATRSLYARVQPNLRAFDASKQPKVWALALLIGICVSFAAIVFRESIAAMQLLWLRDASENVASAARAMPWWAVLLGPIVGGLIVGLLLERILPQRRAGGVSDVMEAKAMGGRNIEFWPGMASALVNAVSLGFGASAGREGPMVHMGAAISHHARAFAAIAGMVPAHPACMRRGRRSLCLV